MPFLWDSGIFQQRTLAQRLPSTWAKFSCNCSGIEDTPYPDYILLSFPGARPTTAPPPPTPTPPQGLRTLPTYPSFFSFVPHKCFLQQSPATSSLVLPSASQRTPNNMSSWPNDCVHLTAVTELVRWGIFRFRPTWTWFKSSCFLQTALILLCLDTFVLCPSYSHSFNKESIGTL